MTIGETVRFWQSAEAAFTTEIGAVSACSKVHGPAQCGAAIVKYLYAYQREVRIVMEAYDMPRQPLQPEFLDIGPMVDYAELLTA